MSSESDAEPDDVSPHVHLKISPAKKRNQLSRIFDRFLNWVWILVSLLRCVFSTPRQTISG